MRKEQYLLRRERDINTTDQFMMSIAVSCVIHLALVLAAVLFTTWSYKQRIIVPGYKVNLVSAPKAGSLLKPTVAKKKRAVKKKKTAKKTKIKKATYKITKKKKSKAEKKIVPKKKKPKKLAKKTPQPKRVKTTPDKVILKKKKTDVKPGKTLVAEGTPFEYIWYLKIIERKVNENWVTHGIDISRKRQDPVVAFSIARGGAIQNVMMKESSGSRELDASAIEAVRKATPFPPLPDDFSKDNLTIFFKFDYEQSQ